MSGSVRNELSGTVGGNAVQVGHADAVHIGGAPAAPAVPHEVPAQVRGFVNRENELAEALRLLDPASGEVRIGLVTGLPGVGKTAMVQRVAARTEFPGGELYVDFARLRDGGGTAVNDGLADCLRALGVHDSVMPPSLNGRMNLYRTRTRERPLLVVLDDVTDPAEVTPFVPSSVGSAVMVTSNSQLSELLVDDAATMSVEPLSEDSGVELLRALSGKARWEAEPGAMRELAGLCGGLPLVLGVAAARLRAHSSLAVSELLGEIRAEDGGLSPFALPGADRVASVFTACYRDLAAPAAELYRALGVFPGADFDVELVAALGDERREQLRALEELVEANLVADKGTGRYRMHDLIRRHARGCADAAPEAERTRREVLDRAVEHYLVLAAFADLAIMGEKRLRITDHSGLLSGDDPFDGDKLAALDRMDAERANLMAVQRVALELGRYRAAWQLGEAMSAFYVNRRYLEDWIESTRLAVSAADLDDCPAAAARLRSFVSRAHADRGDLDAARVALEESLPVAEESGDARLIASIWELVGRLRDEQGWWQAAIEAYQRAIELFTSAEDARGAAFVTFFLGRGQHRLGDSREALATLERAVPAIREVPDSRMAARALATIGEVHHVLGETDRAVGVLQQAIAELVAGADLHYEAQAREALAGVAAAQGRTPMQRENLERALAIHEHFGGPRVDELREALSRI